VNVSSIHSAINRIQKQIADIRAKDAQEARKEADYVAKANRATLDAGKAKSPSTSSSKIREAEQAQKKAAECSTRRAGFAKDLASKSSELMKNQTALTKEEQQQSLKAAKEIDRRLAAQQRKQKDLERSIITDMAIFKPTASFVPNVRYDVFICHASEDKEEFVHELAVKLKAAGLNIFYDAMTLEWGDSLRQVIDHGLANSKFGVVVLSQAFFTKEWPQRELDGLFGRELEGKSRILPIWHKISKDEVLRKSPMLAGKLALNTASLTIDEIVERLLEISGRS